MTRIKEHFINSFAAEISQINGTDFEYLCKPVLAILLKEDVLHKGHNLYGKPVGYTADFISNNCKIIGQCGTEPNYFDNFTKPIHDIDRCIKNHSKCNSIYLFSNQRATGGVITKLDEAITKKRYSQEVKIYDSERIANIIHDNVTNSLKVEEVLGYLPKTFEYYRILPQTNKLPSFKGKYYERSEEKTILEILEKENFIQIYGLSGIGKSELSISLCNSLKNKFESIIWINGNEFKEESMNLSSVQITRFKNTLNLEYLLQEFKVLIIIDNLNSNTQEFYHLFNLANRKNSRCIITSLQKNFNKQAFELSFIDRSTAEEFLYDIEQKPSVSQAKKILDQIKGYPLVISLIKSSIEVDDFTWDEIILEIDNLKDFPDPNNQKLSNRIIGKFKLLLKKELQWICVLNNQKISRHYLTKCLSKKSIIELEKRSLIRVQDLYLFDIHQLVLDSIQLEIGAIDFHKIHEGLLIYLKENNEVKTIEYYRFLLNHKDFVTKIFNSLTYNEELKKVILYALIQSMDSFNSPKWFINELNSIDYNLESNYYDLVLFIEKSEIELYQIPKNTIDYEEKSEKTLDTLKLVLTKVESDHVKIVLYHHIGKLYLKNKNSIEAQKYFELVLNIDSEADYCHLQLARLFLADKKQSDAENEISKVLDRDIDLSKQSLSVILSFYELISRNEFEKIRKIYIENKIDFFIKVVLNSIDSNFEQPYKVIEKLSSYLGYILKDIYSEICEMLPLPSNLENNRSLRFSFAKIKLSQYKLLKYSKGVDKSALEHIFNLSEKYFNTSYFENDFERKQLLDLYISADKYEKALEFSESFEDKDDPFLLQNICKIYRGKGEYQASLRAINYALDKGVGSKPFFIAAFLNDKAETLFRLKDKTCLSEIQKAIDLQNTIKTKNIWLEKKIGWEKELKI